MYVALGIKHAKCVRHIVLSSATWPVLQYFFRTIS